MNISNTMLIDTHRHTHTLSLSFTHLSKNTTQRKSQTKQGQSAHCNHPQIKPIQYPSTTPQTTHTLQLDLSKQADSHSPTHPHPHTHQKRSKDQLSTTGGGISLDTNLLQTKPVPWCGRRIASTSGKHPHNSRLPLLGDVKSRINTYTHKSLTPLAALINRQ